MLKIQQVLRNENGENVLNDYFDTIIIKDQFVIVKNNKLTGLFNAQTLNPILHCEWDKIVLDGDYILAYKNCEIAIFDVTGKRVLEFNCNKAVLYSKGILVTSNDKQGFFKYDGTAILECVWKRVELYPDVIVAYKGNGARRLLFDYEGNMKNN